jgi:DNA-binding winged helix-turn-helix (wHTH) protein
LVPRKSSRDGEVAKLEPRTMRLLLSRAENPGQIVSVQELLDKVWTDVIVTQDSVYQSR